MTSKFAIYNDALLALGQERLASLSEATTARYALDDGYDRAVAFCLESGYWNFAMRSVQMQETPSIAPAFGYSNGFTKPSDLARVFIISTEETFRTPLLDYIDEAGYWFANSDSLYVRYVSNGTKYGGDLSLWPESFDNYVSSRLATQVCKRITGSDPSEYLLKTEKASAADARSKDAMGEPPGFPPRGTWVRSRNYGNVSTRWDRQT